MTKQAKITVVAALALISLFTLIPSLVGATPLYTAVELFPEDAAVAAVTLEVEYGPQSGSYNYNFTFTNQPGSGWDGIGIISVDFGTYEDGTKVPYTEAPSFEWLSVAGGSLMNVGDAIWVLPSPTLDEGDVLPTFVLKHNAYVASMDVLLRGFADTQTVEFPNPVPEPGSLLLIGAAFLILAGIIRKMPYNLIR